MQGTRYSCQILIKLEFSRQIFEKSKNIKFHENPFIGSRVVPCKRADGRKRRILRVAFRDLANEPKGNGGYRILVQEPIRKRSFGILKWITAECGVTSMYTAHAHLRIRIGGGAP